MSTNLQEQVEGGKDRDPIYQLIAEDLKLMGVETSFYLMSDDTIGLCVAMDAVGIQLCAPRHENNAILAAEGYAVATGKLGVAVIGRGPAAANGMHGIMVAARSGSPVLIIMGDAEHGRSSSGIGPDYKAYNAQAIMAAAGVQSFTAFSPQVALEALRHAVAAARKGTAVVLHIPASVQDALVTRATAADAVISQDALPPRRSARAAGINAAVAVLASSKRPLILAGIGAYRSGAREALEALADRTGALLATSFKAKDFFRGSPYNLGVCGSFSTSVARKYIEQADCIVVFGASLNFYTTSKGKALPSVPIIHVDNSFHHIGRWLPIDVSIVADARLAAESLRESIGAKPTGAKPFHDAKVLDEIANFDMASDFIPAHTGRTLDPRSLAMRLNEILPQDRNFIYDAGNFIMVAGYLSVAGPRNLKISSDFASMGAGFGTALGFALGRPDEVNVLVIGDGGFLMTMSELETVARSGIPLVILVVNDCAYGAELQFCRHRNLPEATSVFADIDFAPIGEALGFQTATLRTMEDVDRLSNLFEDWHQPILIDCKVNADIQAPFIGELMNE